MRHSDYTAYFRQIAERHKDIAHSSTAMHFARVIIERDIFGKSNLDEFLSAQRSKIRFPFLLLEAYDHQYADNRSDNIKKQYNGAFIILEDGNGKNADFDKIEQFLDRTEQIGEDILAYMIDDFRKNLHKRFLYVDESTGEKVGPVAGLYGTRFQFSFTENANQYLNFNPDKWQ